MAKNSSQNTPIKAPQQIIHIRHSITLRQYKYWILMIKLARESVENGKGMDNKGFFSFSLKEIIKYIGYEPSKESLHIDLGKLREERIVANYLQKDGGKVLHEMGFLSEFKINSKTISVRFPSLLEEIIQLDEDTQKMFLLLNWQIFNSFQGKYEAIIYKLCKDYIGIGRTPFFSIPDFRDYIGLNADEYPEYKALNRRCISTPIQIINDSPMSDIEITIHNQKERRTITGFWLEVHAKSNKEPTIPSNQVIHQAFLNLRSLISEEMQKKYLQMYSEDKIVSIIKQANKYADSLKEKGKFVNYKGIYKKAFENDWSEDTLKTSSQEKANKPDERNQNNETVSKFEDSIEQMKKIQNEFESLPKEIQENILDRIEEILPKTYLTRFRNNRKTGEAHLMGSISQYLKQIMSA